MLIPPLFTAPAGLEIGQHLTSTTVRCLHQPDPPFSSVTHVMCFGFRAPVYGRQLIWTAVVKDILIVCVDGLKGFPQAIETVFPEARVQLCIVHMVRASLNYVNWKERKFVAADLKVIYRAATERQAAKELDEFIAKWGGKYQAIGAVERKLGPGNPIF